MKILINRIARCTSKEELRELIEEVTLLIEETDHKGDYGSRLIYVKNNFFRKLKFDECKNILIQLVTDLQKKLKSQIESTRDLKAFIVHGANDKIKLEVMRQMTRIGVEPIVLHEQVNSGRSILEKLEKNSDVDVAVVLLTGDDVGYRKNESRDSKKLRARQNVILELGYFLGRLGTSRVIALVEKNDDFEIELPSDYLGIVYIPINEGSESWVMTVVRELKSLGLNIQV